LDEQPQPQNPPVEAAKQAEVQLREPEKSGKLQAGKKRAESVAVNREPKSGEDQQNRDDLHELA
jgi:hypothetical protein